MNVKQEVNKQKLVVSFRELGLSKGDVLLVHSAYKSFGGVEGGPQTVIDALLEVLGGEGTLVVPTFTFAFCEQFNNTGKGYFDLDNTPSETGILTEFVRKMPGAKRNLHPIHSFAAYGKLADELSSASDKSSFGKETVLAKLHKLDAKIMMIGVSYFDCMVFFRYVEQTEGTKYRYIKDFSGDIIVSGKKYQDTFNMNVRDLDRNVILNNDPMGEIIERMGLVNIIKIGPCTIKLLISANAVYQAVAKEMKRNPKVFYATAID